MQMLPVVADLAPTIVAVGLIYKALQNGALRSRTVDR